MVRVQFQMAHIGEAERSTPLTSTSERHGIRRFAERRIGLVSCQMGPQRICERKLALLLGQGDRLPFGLDGLRKEALFGVSGGQRVEDCGVVSSGKLLGSLCQSNSLSTIADRGVGAG